MDSEELKKQFNYVPKPHEKWCIYQDRFLVVISENERPHIYENSDGEFYNYEWIF